MPMFPSNRALANVRAAADLFAACTDVSRSNQERLAAVVALNAHLNCVPTADWSALPTLIQSHGEAAFDDLLQLLCDRAVALEVNKRLVENPARMNEADEPETDHDNDEPEFGF